MTTHHEVPVVCECGHTGTVHWSENDQPFSRQWEKYSISGFDGEMFEIGGSTNVTDALKKMKPKCPSCGRVGKLIKRTS